MSLGFRDIDVACSADVECFVRWSNDPVVRHLWKRSETRAQSERSLQFDFAQHRLTAAIANGGVIKMILWHGAVVGEVSLALSGHQAVSTARDTAWFGLVIGEARGRGRGIGRLAMAHIEECARQKGAIRSEVGVFQYNIRAQRLYRSLGYREFATTPNCTWWQGKMWPDIRFHKQL